MTVVHAQLSRLVSRVLRHEPWVYELELDPEGWVSLPELLDAVHLSGPRWAGVSREDLQEMVQSSAKRRHEIDGDRIRALYGHSTPGRIMREEADPPELLFHGTSPTVWADIRTDGLRPMGRQYVHLSTDVAAAREVGCRKSPTPVVLTVHAKTAHDHAGVHFWQGNEQVWLADFVPAKFIASGSPG